MKIILDAGESVQTFVSMFHRKKPTLEFIHGYLWVGGDGGPCYATCAKRGQLIKLAREILKKFKVKP